MFCCIFFFTDNCCKHTWLHTLYDLLPASWGEFLSLGVTTKQKKIKWIGDSSFLSLHEGNSGPFRSIRELQDLNFIYALGRQAGNKHIQYRFGTESHICARANAIGTFCAGCAHKVWPCQDGIIRSTYCQHWALVWWLFVYTYAQKLTHDSMILRRWSGWSKLKSQGQIIRGSLTV